MSQTIKFSQTISAKILFMGLLILFLLIPSFMMNGIIKERKSRQQEAKTEVSEKWGNVQELVGPVLKIPYQESVILSEKDKNGTIIKRPSINYGTHWISLEDFNLDFKINPEIRKRGIFEVILYKAKVQGEGHILPFDLEKKNQTILWEEAQLQIGLRDLHGLKTHPQIKWGDRFFDFQVEETNGGSILFATIPVLKNGGSFVFDFDIQGSEQLYFNSVAKTTKVTMQSDWKTPSFVGRHLPENHNITDQGFTAEWNLQSFEIPQEISFLSNYKFSKGTGVKLIFPVDFYQKNERAIKYNILFIVLTFVAFFLLEILRKHRVHPIQYLLIGLSMILFYALLLSLSEHFDFVFAYLISAGVIILLISSYCWAVLKNPKSASIILGLLCGIYTYLYVLLQLQDYALLSGTLFLLFVLSMVMFLTRKINWYKVNVKGE